MHGRTFFLTAAFAVGAGAACAEDAALSGPRLSEAYFEFEYEREERARAATAFGRKLLSLSPRIGGHIDGDDWTVNFNLGPRRMVGHAGGFDVNAYGYRVDGYFGYQAQDWLLIGLGAGYQLDAGTLSAAPFEFDARLDTGQLTPFFATGAPVGDGLLKGGVKVNFERSRLKVDQFNTTRFSTHDVETWIEYDHPITAALEGAIGVTWRYTFEEEVALNSRPRAEHSAMLEAGIGYDLAEDLTLRLEGDLRLFDNVVDEHLILIGVTRTF